MESLRPAALLFVFATTGYPAQREIGPNESYPTINAAVTAAKAGDILNIHAGRYSETVKVNKAGLTFQPNGSDAVTLVGFFEVAADNTTIKGLEITGWTGRVSGIQQTGHTGLTVENCQLHAGSGQGDPIDTNNTTGPLSGGIRLRNSTKTTLTNLDIYGCVFGVKLISAHSTDGTYVNGTVMTNVNVHDCANDGFQIQGQYITLQDSTIQDNISLAGSGRKGYHSDGIQFIKNTPAGADGFYNVQHARVLRNTFRNATQNIFVEGPTTQAEGYSATSPGVLRDVLIANNVCYTTSGTLVHGADPSRQFTTKGIVLKAPNDCRVYNNTVIGCTNGISIGKGGGQNSIKNNVVIECKIGIGVGSPASLAAGEMDYNLYFANGKDVKWKRLFTTLAKFRANQPAYERHSVGQNPKLNALPSPTLQNGSPAVGAGIDLSAYFTTDRTGASRPASWDIGAYASSSGRE